MTPASHSRRAAWLAAAAALIVVAVAAVVLLRSSDSETDTAMDAATSTVTDAVADTEAVEPPVSAEGSAATLDTMLLGTTPTTVPPTTSTTVPAPEPIIRPIVADGSCETLSARDSGPNGSSTVSFVLFARPSSEPVPIQIIGDPVDGPAAPFALVQRLVRDRSGSGGQEQVEINGITTAVNTFDNGNGEAVWNLPDGSEGYLRSRGLDRDTIVSLLERLSPRDSAAEIPGFDVAPGPADGPLELLHEQMNTRITGTAHLAQCIVPTSGFVYRIAALDGDPVFEYGGVIDRPPPLEVGFKNGTLITIMGIEDPSAPHIDGIDNARADDWLEFRSRPDAPFNDGGPRTEAIWVGRDLVFELFPVDSTTVADRSYVTIRLSETQGVSNFEYETEDVVLAPDAAFWVLEINGRPRLKTTARVGSLTGSRLDDSVVAEPFTFSLRVEDLGGFTLQSTGEIQLLPQFGS